MNYSETAFQRCVSYAKHSGKTLDQMAAAASVDVNVVKRLRASRVITYPNLARFERSIPKNWRDPLPERREVA